MSLRSHWWQLFTRTINTADAGLMINVINVCYANPSNAVKAPRGYFAHPSVPLLMLPINAWSRAPAGAVLTESLVASQYRGLTAFCAGQKSAMFNIVGLPIYPNVLRYSGV